MPTAIMQEKSDISTTQRGRVRYYNTVYMEESNLGSTQFQPHLAVSHLQMLSTRARIGGSQPCLKLKQVVF